VQPLQLYCEDVRVLHHGKKWSPSVTHYQVFDLRFFLCHLGSASPGEALAKEVARCGSAEEEEIR
jgi:hypothetical protein